jgi:hypothetical protein
MGSTREPEPVSRLIALLRAANFCAALGGGTILGKAMGVLNAEPLLEGDSLVAMVGGTALGFLALLWVKKRRWERRADAFAWLTGLLSLFLCGLLATGAAPAGQITGLSACVFFFALTLRWGSWYVGRSLRAETAAFHFQRIPVVEFTYFCGIMAGLVAWDWSGLMVGLSAALLIDVALQAAASVLDWFAGRYMPGKLPEASSPVQEATVQVFQAGRCWRVVVAAIAMTVGAQIVMLTVAHGASSPQMVAAFYGGAAAAAALCWGAAVQFQWGTPTSGDFGWIEGKFIRNRQVRMPLVAGAAAVLTAVIVVFFTAVPAPLLFALATCFLGLTTLPLFNHAGHLAKRGKRPMTVAVAFGLMGFAGTVALIALVRLKASAAALVIVDLAGLLVATVAIRWPVREEARPEVAP